MLTTTESPSTMSIGVWLFGSAATAGGLGWLPLAYPFPYPLPLAWPLPWPFSASMAGVVSLVVSKVRRSSMLGRAFDMARSGGRPAHHASLPGSAGAVSAPRAPRTSINGAQRLAPVSAPRSSAYLSASGWLAGEAHSVVVRSSRSRLFSQTRLPPPSRPAPLGSTRSRARALNPLRLLSRNAGAAAGGGWVEENAGLRGPPHPPRMGARCCQAGGAPLDPAPLRRRTTQQRHGPAPPMVLRRRRQRRGRAHPRATGRAFQGVPQPVCKRLGAALWVPTGGMRVLWAQDGTVEVEDVSGGCGSFMKVTVTSAEFANKPRVKQHRMVQEVIKEEVAALHGLNIITGVAE